MAGLIVACDALTQWCAGLIDQGYRGEMECIVAKIFGSEAQKEAAIELFMKTHGGRSFLQGHLFGDNVHEFLAPCIYEGRGRNAGHGVLQVAGQTARQALLRTDRADLACQGNPSTEPEQPGALVGTSQAHGCLRKVVCDAASGRLTLDCACRRCRKNLRRHAKRAQAIAVTQRVHDQRHDATASIETCRSPVPDVSRSRSTLQDAIVMLVTSLYAAESQDPMTVAAADTICRELDRKITGGQPGDDDFRQVTRLGEQIATDGWGELRDVCAGEILMPYKQE